MTATAPRWQLAVPDELHIHPWDEEVAVYDGVAGDTHLLSPIAAAVLLILQRSPATLTELVDELASADDAYPPDELHRYVNLLLGDLCKLGIVEST